MHATFWKPLETNEVANCIRLTQPPTASKVPQRRVMEVDFKAAQLTPRLVPLAVALHHVEE